jgi:iron complex transport system substrate-binding protein
MGKVVSMGDFRLGRRRFVAGAGAALGASLIAGPARAQGAAKSITTKLGTYDVPLDPKRIVLIGNRMDLETVVALGLKPVAMGIEFRFINSHADTVAPWVPFDPAGVETFDMEASAEQILSYEPDLIFIRDVATGWNQPRTDALMDVAPIITTGGLPWREDLAQIGEWLGRSEQAAATAAEFDALVETTKARHAEKLATAKVAFGSIEPPQVWVTDLTADAPAAQGLRALGGQAFTLPADAATYEGGWAGISPENLSLISDADALLFWGPTPDVFEQFHASTPLWDRLPAVEGGRAVISENNVGNGSVYTVMQTLRLWDQVYGTLA